MQWRRYVAQAARCTEPALPPFLLPLAAFTDAIPSSDVLDCWFSVSIHIGLRAERNVLSCHSGRNSRPTAMARWMCLSSARTLRVHRHETAEMINCTCVMPLTEHYSQIPMPDSGHWATSHLPRGPAPISATNIGPCVN